jgi:hypothetical protein
MADVIGDDRWWSVMIGDDRWWSVMIGDDRWWSVMIGDDRWWSVMIGDDRWWQVMTGDDRWWQVMIGRILSLFEPRNDSHLPVHNAAHGAIDLENYFGTRLCVLISSEPRTRKTDSPQTRTPRAQEVAGAQTGTHQAQEVPGPPALTRHVTCTKLLNVKGLLATKLVVQWCCWSSEASGLFFATH